MTANLVLIAFALLAAILLLASVQFFLRSASARSVRRPRDLLVGNGLLAGVLASLALLGGECYFRFVHDTTDAFGLSRVTREWMRRHEQMNAFGFRDSVEYSLERAQGKRRVTLIGDSFTAGHGIADVERRFANLLRHAHPEWEVQVLATNGFDTGEELRLVESLVAARHALDLVVLVYCLNDIADIVPQWSEVQARLYQRPPPPFLVQHSYLLDTLHSRWVLGRDPRLRGYYDFVLDAYGGDIWARQCERLSGLAELVRGDGGKLVAVTFPFLHCMGAEYPHAAIHARIDAEFQALHVPHLDLLPTFLGSPPRELMVNSRDPHPNEHAHALAARAIGAFLGVQLQGG